MFKAVLKWVGVVLLGAVVLGALILGWARPIQAAKEVQVTREVTQVVEKVVKETVVVRETAVPVAAATTKPTAILTAVSSQTEVVASTVVVAEPIGLTLVHPIFFEGQSSGKEYTASYDVGVKPGQVGIAFGYAIQWQGRSLGYPTDKCGLVVLLPGWYEKFTLTDGRYEVYDLPNSNREFWIKDLARQRAEEQANHYACSLKTDVPVWESSLPAVVWSIVQPPEESTASATPMVAVTPTAIGEAAAAPTKAVATATCERLVTGVGNTLAFAQGDTVVGYQIEIAGETCTSAAGSTCWLKSAPAAGEVTDGVVCPWTEEIPTNPEWEPRPAG